MNKKTFVCSKASLAIPSQVNTITDNKFVMVSGYIKTRLNILKGEFTETSKNVDAGLQVTQKLNIEARLVSGTIPNANIVMLELSLSDIGDTIWGTSEIPVIIVSVQNNMPNYKIALQRMTYKREF